MAAANQFCCYIDINMYKKYHNLNSKILAFLKP